jgi:hypothetical protein
VVLEPTGNESLRIVVQGPRIRREGACRVTDFGLLSASLWRECYDGNDPLGLFLVLGELRVE